jgi:tetratricopeptide (TPR) repeat protein
MLRQVPYKTYALYLLFILLAVLGAYYNVISADFISWDDADFTVNNKNVKAFDLKAFFSNFYLGNYTPLTMTSFSFDYYFGKENAGIYHLHNIVLHAANSFLVFLLFCKIQSNKHIALMVALIFALHPMQTESVSWVSERKNLVYGLYYITSLILYTNYIRSQTTKNYLIVLLAFLCALFSKGMAVSLPFALFALDIWLNRTLNKKILFEKIPFLLLSFIFGIIAIKAQAAAGFLKVDQNFSFVQNILFSGYAFMQYVLKLFVPIGLSAVYPYPKITFSFFYLTGILLFLIVIFLIIYNLKKNKKILAGGLLFFVGNIIFVLQLVKPGAVLMADHYVYIACLGLIFPFVNYIFSSLKNSGLPLLISSLLLIALLVSSFKRNQVWRNEITFWEDVVKKYPNSEVALSSLGAEYMLNGNDEKAFDHFNRAINLNPDYLKAYYNRGLLYAKNNRFEKAIKDLTKATAQKKYFKAYLSRAEVFYKLKDYSRSLDDIQTVLASDPDNANANYIAGNCHNDLNQLDMAINYYNKCIHLNPNQPRFYFSRAIVLGKQQKFTECLDDLKHCTNLDPNFAEAYYWKGVAKINLKQNPCPEFEKAMRLGSSIANTPFLKYCK